jgi:hypothetical protein
VENGDESESESESRKNKPYQGAEITLVVVVESPSVSTLKVLVDPIEMVSKLNLPVPVQYSSIEYASCWHCTLPPAAAVCAYGWSMQHTTSK